MRNLGYKVRGECLDNGGTPGRYYYSKDINYQRTHKVHICKAGHPDIGKMLFFRDYLNANPQKGAQYAELKEKLCAQYGYDDIQKYLAGKKGFIPWANKFLGYEK